MNSNPRPTTIAGVHELLELHAPIGGAYWEGLDHANRTSFLLGMCEAKLAEAYRELNRLETANDPRRS